MSEFTAANFGGMAAGQQEFLQIYSTLTGTLDDLQRNLESTLSAWSGSARQAYHVAKQQWDGAAANMAMVLNQMGRVIGEANQAYQATEQSLSQMWD